LGREAGRTGTNKHPISIGDMDHVRSFHTSVLEARDWAVKRTSPFLSFFIGVTIIDQRYTSNQSKASKDLRH